MNTDSSPLPYSRQALRPEGARYFSRQFGIISQAGAGKSTLADKIAESFHPHLKRVSGGAFMRKRAAERGMTIGQFAAHMEQHPEEGHDQWCDDQIMASAMANDVVIDTHLPAFVPNGFMIYLVCGLETRGKRRTKPGEDVSAVTAALKERDRNDLAKYARIYPGSIWLYWDYDLVINTETHDPGQCLAIALREHDAWLEINRNRCISDVLSPQWPLVPS
jgi:cytidylate kinase